MRTSSTLREYKADFFMDRFRQMKSLGLISHPSQGSESSLTLYF